MKKWLALALLTLALLAGYITAGPFLAVKAIRAAIKEQNAAELSKHIDFPALRSSFRLQLDDYLVRRAGPEMQSSVLGALALSAASGATGGIVDAMATPAGLAAVLEGRSFWHRLNGFRRNEDAFTASLPSDPLEGATYRFESPSRFTATVSNADGDPVVFVLTREGLRWKISDVRLPL
ncbi:MAG TPA: DUF2939 domain-containing protein [Lysobacter sp.]|nr:DUF2939 domain-containing protein [Lysobacter sp.]